MIILKRIAIFKEARAISVFLKKRKVIHELVCDEFFQTMFNEYPYEKMQLKRRIFFFAMKYRLDCLIAFLTRKDK